MTEKKAEGSGVFIEEQLFNEIKKLDEEMGFAVDEIDKYRRRLQMAATALDKLKDELKLKSEEIIKQCSISEGVEWTINPDTREIVYLKEIKDGGTES